MTSARPRKLVAAVIVLAIHVALIAALIRVTELPSTPAPALTRFTEVFLRAPPQVRTIMRAVSGPARFLSVPDIPAPQIDIAPTAPGADAISGIGRALFGCALENLAALPPEQRGGCLNLPMRHPPEPSLRLEPYDANAPFARVIAKRNAPVVPMEHACAPNEGINSNLGLPCFTFPNGAIEGLMDGTK